MGTTGPQDCPLVYLVMTDDELRAGVHAAAVRARTTGRSDHPEATAAMAYPAASTGTAAHGDQTAAYVC